MRNELNVAAVCEYRGDSIWSDERFANVRIEKIVLLPEDDDDKYEVDGDDGDEYSSSAYMEIYFNLDDWDTEKLGLLYTSASFLNGIADLLRGELGEFADKIAWTEQGMQWWNYASVCVRAYDNPELFREKFHALCEKYSGRVLT